jgi:hypothetical protein
MAYFLSQELHVLKPTPVENFGAAEAIISMHASTKNADITLTQSLAS